MPTDRTTLPILLAEDDLEDQTFARDALLAARLMNELIVVQDGQELLDCLRGTGAYAGAPPSRPGLILLDLKMPRMGGLEALAEIKNDAALRSIPIVVLTTSGVDEDIARSYALGVNSFIQKPVTFSGLVEAIRELGHYWFQLVELPPRDGRI
ncbi:MAG: response regulator [Gemmatimonadetes bacterium]|nr:response regulator [Gemmatimonadota bacterium]